MGGDIGHDWCIKIAQIFLDFLAAYATFDHFCPKIYVFLLNLRSDLREVTLFSASLKFVNPFPHFNHAQKK